MKKVSFAMFFCGTQVVLIFLQIYKSTFIINQMYRKQQTEHEKEQLMNRKQQLLEQLYRTKKNSQEIAHFARTQLHLNQVKINQIKKLNA